MKLPAKALTGVIIVSGILFALILAYPLIASLVISAATGVTIDNNASSIAIISSADGPTAVIQSYAKQTGILVLWYGLLGICALTILLSAIRLGKLTKATKPRKNEN